MRDGRLRRFVGDGLFLFCCVAAAGRCLINESFALAWRFTGPAETTVIGEGEETTMLLFSGLIWVTGLLWVLVEGWGGEIRWRKTGMGVGFLILLGAAIVSTWAASNRHTAMISALNLLSLFGLGMLLVQLLEVGWRRRVLMCVIAATGVTMAYHCWEQYYFDAPSTLELVREDPQTALERQGIRPGTWAARQFMDRLESGDIRGYFSVSNTTAAFFILSIMVTLGLAVETMRRADKNQKQVAGAVCVLVGGAQVYGIYLTGSKGGLVGLAVAILGAVLLWWGRGVFVRHWKGWLCGAAGLVVLAVAAVAGWGVHSGRLPGNSMWVRWQYWQGSAGMIRDHVWTGVGAGNFGTYYPRYMDAAALEVVKDPHSWVMALWSEWGLLGLVGFLVAIGYVSVLLARPREEVREAKQVSGHGGSWMHAVVYGVLVGAGILLVRLLNSSGLGELGEEEKESVYLMSFVVPAMVWVVGFFLCWGGSESAGQGKGVGGGVLLLGCGLGGFLVHNSVDMAAFHPGVGSLFLATVALAIAGRGGGDSSAVFVVGRGKWLRRGLCVWAVVAVVMLWVWVVWPYRGAHVQMREAQRLALTAYNLVESFEKGKVASRSAAQWDELQREALEAARRASRRAKWDPESLEFEGRLLFFLHQSTGGAGGYSLEEAIARMSEAGGRDRENYRFYRQLSDLYGIAARKFSQRRGEYEKRALEAAERAYELNPAKGEIGIAYGRLLMGDGQVERGLGVFRKVVEDERRFLQQQREMFGSGRRLTGRLPEEVMEELERELKAK